MVGTSVTSGTTVASVVDGQLGAWLLGERIDHGIGTTTYAAIGAEDGPFAGRAARLTLSDPVPGGDPDVVRLAFVADAVRGLRHASLAPVLDAGTVDGRLFVAHVVPPGESLGECLSSSVGAFGPADVLRVMSPLAAGLAHAHDGGVAHGDIRPGTIVLDRDGGPVLGGFGGGVATGSVELDPTLAAYAAPERLLGEPGVAADQYALAATGVSLLIGREPEGDGITALDGRGVPAQAIRVLERVLSPSAADRFSTVTAFAEAFATALDDAADDVILGIWEALERRDYPMATILVTTAQRLRPDHPRLPMLDAHVAQLAGGAPAMVPIMPPDVVEPSLPQSPSPSEPDETAKFLASLTAPPPLLQRDGKEPWMVFAIGGLLGLALLALLALAAFLVL